MRIKIPVPASFSFKTEIPVRIGDLNYGGHVGNEVFLAYAQEARVHFLNQLGYAELNLEGVGLIMADAAINYKAEAFHGDTLVVEVTANDPTRMGFDLVYRMTNKANGKEVCIVKTGMVCFDYENKKVAMLPEAAKEKLFS